MGIVLGVVSICIAILAAALSVGEALSNVVFELYQLRMLLEDDMGMDTCHVVENDEIDGEEA